MTEQILAAKIKTLLRAWFVSLLSSNLLIVLFFHEII